MNTKKFVAMDSTIHYLQSFEKKMESWRNPSGNLKMEILKFKRRNLLANCIKHYNQCVSHAHIN